MYFEFPLWHVFSTIWPLTDMCFSVQFAVTESRGMSCLTWMQYLTYSILLRPLIALSSTCFLVVLFSTCSLTWCMCFFRHRSWNEWKHVWTAFRSIQSSHFQSSSPFLLSILSGVVWPLVQMFHYGILLSLPYLYSGPHELPWVRHFCFRIFRPCEGFSFPYSWFFTDLLVSIVFFFLHFHNGGVHPVELCSDWIRDFQ